MTDFIGVYDNLLADDFCERLITKFDASTERQPGLTGAGLDVAKKDSSDISISSSVDWHQDCIDIGQAALAGMVQYVRRYPFMLVGSIATAIKDPSTGEVRSLHHQDIELMRDDQIAQMIRRIYRMGSMNLQSYRQQSGGYHHWHSEIYPHPQDSQNDSLQRVLFWILYLNDVEEGGETEFFYQQQRITPKRGRLIIAPAGFTHTHKGRVPQSSDKYILASWVLFQPASTLYRS